MRTLLYFLFALIIFSACRNNAENGPVKGAMEAFKTDPSLKNYNDLIIATNEAMEQNGGMDSELILSTLSAITEAGKAESGQEWVMELLKNNSSFDGREDVVAAYADLWEKDLQKPTQASILRQGLLKNYPELPALSIYKNTLDGLPPVEERIKGFAEKIFNGESGDFNPKVAYSFIPACENYAIALPKDSLSPNFLIDAATIARNLNQTQKVLELFKWVYTNYPESPKAGDARFSEAFTYDNDLKDYDRAKVAYEAFLKDYPTHPFAESAQVMLNNLGKSDEQIIRELEAKAKAAE